ncbi:MAG: DUF4954 family protein [Bacteroidales bacterium]|nr:DUF4954 family protein [Bacteroidales bacterium]
MVNYRRLEVSEIARLQAQMCTASDWNGIEVADGFSTDHVSDVRFSGKIRLGAFRKEFCLAGGIHKHSGIYHATLHNVTVGDDCLIENISNYIANYVIGRGTFIENVDIILTDGPTAFGNGVQVSVLNETGGNEVVIYDRLSAQTAYVMAVYRRRPELILRMKEMAMRYAASVTSSTGIIGEDVIIVDSGYIKNVRIGDRCRIEGAARLKNGSINSNVSAPVHIGIGVIGDDFIISSGSSITDGVTFSRCFIGQACRLGHNYSATDSLFFSNCQGENGEACAIFAGPFTVTHHKSTLLIAGMFSFMNAGSGSNQSNHMYKLGPIHHGLLERGAKTASDSYVLWPAKIGAFSLVMGRHVCHQDTRDLPFSYLIEQESTSYIVPGANLKSVGTIRDAKKWPQRDGRTDPDRLDCINFNLLSPYTIRKMINGRELLQSLQAVSGEKSDTYSFQSGLIRRSSLQKGLRLYSMAIDKFLGNSLITRIMNSSFSTLDELHEALLPTTGYGDGEWMDVGGMIVPENAFNALLEHVENGTVSDIHVVEARLREMHENYYAYEWKWAYDAIRMNYGLNLNTASAGELAGLVSRWKESVISLDNLIYEDARKDFALSSMPDFESDPFVASVRDHIKDKSALGELALGRLESIGHLVE